MQPYVLMMQADADDRYLTDSILNSMSTPVLIQYISHLEELDKITAASGDPAVILLNDHGASHPGGEMLHRIKNHPNYKNIPVVILGEVSTSEYIRRCYAAGASTFITKPSSLKETQKKIETFFSYWLEVAETRN